MAGGSGGVRKRCPGLLSRSRSRCRRCARLSSAVPRASGHNEVVGGAVRPARGPVGVVVSWDEQPSPSSRRPRKGWDRVSAGYFAGTATSAQIRGPRCLVAATEVDHIVNVASGGTDDPENLRAACQPCNRQGAGRGRRGPPGALPAVVTRPSDARACCDRTRGRSNTVRPWVPRLPRRAPGGHSG